MQRTSFPDRSTSGQAGSPARRLVRSSRDRVFTGLAGGIGDALGVDPTVIRLSFIALSLAAGIGVLLYMILFLSSADPHQARAALPRKQATTRSALAVGMVVLGALLLLRSAGLWFGDRLVWPTVLASAGSAVIWTRGSDADRSRWSRFLRRTGAEGSVAGWGSRVRLIAGAMLVVGGIWLFLSSSREGGLRGTALAVVAALMGAAVLILPLIWRTARQLAEERRQRIRSQERAEVAAHLHDSVLQTLALIQRSGESREMASLARSQERELRDWLYGGSRAADHTLVSTAMNDAAADVERTHRVAIEVVTAGDRRLDEPANALVLAAREAMVNAARHSGSAHVSVFVECGPHEISAFIRDQGDGFDPAAVPPDRRGIADSIEGRMTRFGGGAQVSSEPGHGAEVRLSVPVDEEDPK